MLLIRKPSHLLLPLFLGFGVAVAAGKPDPATEANRRPRKVVHHWQAPSLPTPTVVLRGRVIDPIGRGVAGATVRGGAAPCRTDADGSFAVRIASRHQTDLRIESTDGRATTRRVLSGSHPIVLVHRGDAPGRVAAPPCDPANAPHGGQGMVRDARGELVVTVCETGVSVVADPTGNYRIPVPAVEFHLCARDAAGQAVLSAAIAPPRPDQRWMPLPDLRLGAAQRVHGTLRDAAGRPVPGGSLVVRGSGVERRVRTATDGAFVVAGLLPGRFTISALPHDGQVGCAEVFDVVPGSPRDLELQLRPNRPITLTVADPTDAPHVGVMVTATTPGCDPVSGLTDASGQVRLDGLPEGELAFEVHRRGGSDWVPLQVVRYDAAGRSLTVQ
ncbi:MAG: carboxypeptidase regulatory-like domain-containing protein [Planctomycetes bacterium]|nr:carboxypeptidase regulatory-like domain-containing protein [Planctomycetota bacterium]